MKTIIITGSARGFGYSMAKYFYEKNNAKACNCGECDDCMKGKKKKGKKVAVEDEDEDDDDE